MANDTYYLGADLGGTQLRMAAVTAEGRLATEVLAVPTGRDFGPEDLRRQLRELSARLRELVGGKVAALGLSTAGVLHEQTLAQIDNLPRLGGLRIEELARAAVDVPVAVENDANCFTLAEARFGAGRGARHLCGIALGTGVGCGVLIDGRLHHGRHSQAGEVWGVPIRGQYLEYYLSGAGVVRGYAAAGGRSGDGTDGARVAALAGAGDPAARAAWLAFAGDLALLCEFMVALLDPDAIVIGGSLAQARGHYGDDFYHQLARHPTRIAFAELGTAAAVIGAAALNISD